MEESVNLLLGHNVLPELVELLTGFDFEGAQVVLVGIVLIYLFLTFVFSVLLKPIFIKN